MTTAGAEEARLSALAEEVNEAHAACIRVTREAVAHALPPVAHCGRSR